MDSSPVKTLQPGNVAATRDMKYSREPESPTFTTSSGRCAEAPAPSTVHMLLSPSSTLAPMSGTARAAERQSALGSGFDMCDVPSASEERISARIVWLFDPGTRILP